MDVKKGMRWADFLIFAEICARIDLPDGRVTRG